MKLYAVIIQDDADYKTPEFCFTIGGDDVGIYKTTEQAQELIEYLVDEGFEREAYSIVELKRI